MSEVTEGGLALSQDEGVVSAVQVGADTQVEVGSGTYRFAYPA